MNQAAKVAGVILVEQRLPNQIPGDVTPFTEYVNIPFATLVPSQVIVPTLLAMNSAGLYGTAPNQGPVVA